MRVPPLNKRNYSAFTLANANQRSQLKPNIDTVAIQKYHQKGKTAMHLENQHMEVEKMVSRNFTLGEENDLYDFSRFKEVVTERGDSSYLLSGIQIDMDCAITVDNKSVGQE